MNKSIHSSFQAMTNAITVKYNDQIKKFCSLLFESLNVNNFWTVKITNLSQYSYLCSHAEWSEYWSSEKLYLTDPFLRHPNCIKEGIYLYKYNDTENRSLKKIFKNSFDSGPAHQQILQFRIRTDDGYEDWGFSSHLSNELQTEIFLNELPLFRLFIKKFCEENQFLISKMIDNQLDASKLIGDLFFKESIPSWLNSQKRISFLQNMGLFKGIRLSSMEDQILKLMVMGLSANQIGEKLFRSKRTIEHHMERMKDKLGCASKAELIQKGRELEQFGYFSLSKEQMSSSVYVGRA